MKSGIGLLRRAQRSSGTGLPPEPQLQLSPASFLHTPSAVQPEQSEMRDGAKGVERRTPDFLQITDQAQD